MNIVFAEELRCELSKRFDCEVILKEVRKNNGTIFHGLELKGLLKDCYPVVYVEDLEDEDIEYAVKVVEGAIEEIGPKVNMICMNRIFDFYRMASSVRYKVINTEMNRALLHKIPHRILPCKELVIVYYLVVSNNQTVLIKNDLMKKWGVSEDELYHLASKYTKKFNHPMLRNLKLTLEDGTTMEPPFMVYKTVSDYLGASALLYKDGLMSVYEEIGDFYIVPSSIHEVLVVACKDWEDEEHLKRIVEDGNDVIVTREEQLSKKLLVFRGKEIEVVR